MNKSAGNPDFVPADIPVTSTRSLHLTICLSCRIDSPGIFLASPDDVFSDRIHRSACARTGIAPLQKDKGIHHYASIDPAVIHVKSTIESYTVIVPVLKSTG